MFGICFGAVGDSSNSFENFYLKYSAAVT